MFASAFDHMNTYQTNNEWTPVSTPINKPAKTPVSVLNEKYPLAPTLIRFEQIPNPVNDKMVPYQRCSLTLDGQQFQAEAASKREAKHAVAEQVLHAMLPADSIELKNLHVPTPKKRPLPEPDVNTAEPVDQLAKKRAKILEKVDSKDPTAIMLELCTIHGSEYKPQFDVHCISESESKPHEQFFTCTLQVKGKTFTSMAGSKRFAKREAAKTALFDMFGVALSATVGKKEEFLEDLNGIAKYKTLYNILHRFCIKKGLQFLVQSFEATPEKTDAKMHYKAKCKLVDIEVESSDSWLSKKEAIEVVCLEAACKFFDIDKKTISDKLNFGFVPNSGQIDFKNKSAVAVLNEICLKNGAAVVYTDLPCNEKNEMQCKCTINNTDFVASGRNKKLAKQEAATIVLKSIFDIDMSKSDSTGSMSTVSTTNFKFFGSDNENRQVFDLVAKAKQKYTEILSDFNVVPTSTFSAIVMTDDQRPKWCEVISVASGARANASRKNDGTSLHDCHSLVLARRGLLLYFYQQLNMMGDKDKMPASIFQALPSTDPDLPTRYELKSRFHFHLYETAAPPGDASADPYETQFKHALRVYQPDGIATVPLPYLLKQFSKQAPSDFNPNIRSMSLTDKILKWNILGVQGSLLSVYMEPVYFESLIFGQNCSKSILKKSFFNRFDSSWFSKNNSSFKPRCPKMYTSLEQCFSTSSSENDASDLKTPTEYALAWNLAVPVIEFIIQESGFELYKRPSRLSKQSFFDHYFKLRRVLPLTDFKDIEICYNEAKQASANYVVAKNKFVNLLKASDLGTWLEKSINLDNFPLPWLSE